MQTDCLRDNGTIRCSRVFHASNHYPARKTILDNLSLPIPGRNYKAPLPYVAQSQAYYTPLLLVEEVGRVGRVLLAGPVLPADRRPLIILFSHINRAETIPAPAEAAKNSNIVAGTIESPGSNGIIFSSV